MQLTQLLVVYQVRRFAHHIVGILGLGEGDDVADRRTFCHQHDHAVQTEGQSSVRRRAIFKGLHHEAEFFLGFFIGEADSFKDGILHVAAMDTDGTAAQFDTVQHHVVRFGIHFAGVGLQHGQVFVAGRRKRMMHGYPAFFILVPLKHRETGNPGKAQLVFIDQVHAFCHFNTQGAQSLCYGSRFVRYEEQQVARFRAGSFFNFVQMGFVKELGDGRFHTAVRLDLHPGQAFGAVDRHKINQSVQFPAGNVGIAFYVDRFHNAAVGNDIVKYFEVGTGNRIHHVDQGHVKTQIRFVAAIFIHGFVPGHALHGPLDIHTQRSFEHISNEAFHHVHDIVHLYERHLHVQLGKFRLTVGTQIFITEAAGNLEIAFVSAYHQQLFENLRRLGKRIELAGIHTAGHQIVPGPFRRALAQHGGLDFQKTIVVHIVPHQLGHFVTQDQIGLHLRTAQVQIAVFQAQILIGVDAVLNIKRRCLGAVQYIQCMGHHFNFTGSNVGIHSLCIPFPYLAENLDHIFAANGFRIFEAFPRIRIDDYLADTGTVPQVNKNQSAMVAAFGYPAAQSHLFAGIRFRQGSAMMIAFKLFTHSSAPLFLK